MSKSGIYEIRNKVNGNIYVGSAVNIGGRWRQHKSELNNNKHGNRHLQSSWNKYGSAAFEFSVIEECDIPSLINREQYFIDTLRPSYNISPTAGSCLGTVRSEEFRAKISAANKGKKVSIETCQKISELKKRTSEKFGARISAVLKGKAKSPEHREKLRKANKGKTLSVETREKISKSNIERWAIIKLKRENS